VTAPAQPPLRRVMTALTAAACAFVYAVQLVVIRRHAVDVPWWDEWDELPVPSLHWVFAQHNEHRLVTSKLLVLALYYVNGWNLATHQTVNFILYGALLAVVTRVCLRSAPGLPAWTVLGFMPFLLSPIASENHNWGLQSQFHFALLFFLAAVDVLYDEAQRWSRLVGAGALCVLATYSAAGGLVSSLVVLGVFCVFKWTRWRGAADAAGRARETRQLLLVASIVGGAVGLWFVRHEGGYVALERDASRLFAFFADLVASGFGVDEGRSGTNLACLLLVLAPILLELCRRGLALPASSWRAYTALAGVLVSLAAISLGRASLGIPRPSRYCEVAVLLVPLSAVAWAIALQGRERLRVLALGGLWIFCLAAFWNDWDGAPRYEAAAKQRRRGLECMARYYAGTGDGYCPGLYPTRMRTKLEYARALDLSAFRAARALPNRPIPERRRDGIGTGSFDSIGPFSAATAPPVVLLRATDPPLYVAGWAADAEAGDEAADVLLLVDGRMQIPLVYGLYRPDVAEAYHNPRLRFVGYTAWIAPQALTPGRHSVSLMILTASGKAYRESAQHIQIEVAGT
jgi:hypothetical protein